MKKIILFVAVLVSTVTFAQSKKDVEQVNRVQKDVKQVKGFQKEVKQVNGGVLLGMQNTTAFFLGMDYGVHEDITINGQVTYYGNSNSNGKKPLIKTSNKNFVLSAKGNYHFNRLLKMPKVWDLYAGLGLDYSIFITSISFSDVPEESKKLGSFEDSSDLGTNGPKLGYQLGARYFFNDQVGVNLEFMGGDRWFNSMTKIGVTYKL